jgi:DNA-binding MarR family transcriptional regulator
MTNNYLLLPLEPLKDISIIDTAILSQLAYMKKAFNELYPSNAFLSSKLNISVSSIKRSIIKLIQYDYITMSIENNNKRFILLSKKTLKLYGMLYIQNNKKIAKTETDEALKKFYNDIGI